MKDKLFDIAILLALLATVIAIGFMTADCIFGAETVTETLAGKII